MEITFRAKRGDGEYIEGDLVHHTTNAFSHIIPIGIKPEGCYPEQIDPATLEIVIDGQAVRVAKIKELLEMKKEIENLIQLQYNDWSDGNVVDEIIKLLNNIDGEDND